MSEKVTKTEIQIEPKKGTRIVKKIVNTIINILIVLVLIVSIVIAVLALTSKSSGISTMFGYTIQPIQSDSMKGGSPDGYEGGDFEKGDFMIAKATDPESTSTYEVGDIVTYTMADTSTGVGKLIVHRIVDVSTNEFGEKVYQTQGDNREMAPEPDQKEVSQYIRAFDIVSVYKTDGYEGKILKGFGNVLEFLQSQQGFFFVILLPMILFFLYELVRVIINVMNYKKSKAEEDKDEAVKEAVAAALAEKEAKDTAPAEMTPEQMEQFKKFLAQQEAEKAEQSPEGPAEEPTVEEE